MSADQLSPSSAVWRRRRTDGRECAARSHRRCLRARPRHRYGLDGGAPGPGSAPPRYPRESATIRPGAPSVPAASINTEADPASIRRSETRNVPRARIARLSRMFSVDSKPALRGVRIISISPPSMMSKLSNEYTRGTTADPATRVLESAPRLSVHADTQSWPDAFKAAL